MPRKKSPAKISASAKVEATAKAVYQRKKTVSEIIPPDVTRAKTGAWLDVISPLTEWAGLKGEQTRHKRDLLRLQRENVLAEIVSRAKQRIESRHLATKPVPNKFLVPFLEQASLEDPDSELVDMWAGLLASAETEYSSHHVHFVSIIFQLSANQGDILKRLIGTDNAHELEREMNLDADFQSSEMREAIKHEIGSLSDKKAIASAVETLFDKPGLVFVHAELEHKETDDFFHIGLGTIYKDEERNDYLRIGVSTIYREDDDVDFSVLQAVGLVRRVETRFFDVGIWKIAVIYYHLTQLGVYFAKACRLDLMRPKAT